MTEQLDLSLLYSLLGCAGLIAVAGICVLLLLGLKRSSESLASIVPTIEVIVPPRPPDGWKTIFPHGGEAFFPRSPNGNLYEIEIVGSCRYHCGYAEIGRADALFRADGARFVKEHYELLINNRPLYHYRTGYQKDKPKIRVLSSERETHHYRLLFEGESVALAFGDPRERWADPNLGHLVARVTPLPAGTRTITEEHETKRRLDEEESKRVEADDAAARAKVRLATTIKALTIRAAVYRNWLDPEFRDTFARVHYDELIEHQAEIRKEATEFLAQPKLVEHLRRRHPDVVTVFLGRLDALQIAERFALDKRLAAPDTLPITSAAPAAIASREKPKLTAQQVKELKVRRQQIVLGDKVALAMDRVATTEQIKIHVREQYAQLAEDEQQRIIQEVLDQIEEEENQNGTTL